MRFSIITALTMATVATSASIPVPALFARSPQCLDGPKRAGNSCDAPNWDARVCGPGQKGNILRCVENQNDDDYHWVVDVRCKPGGNGKNGGCKDCVCRLGPL